MNKATGTRNGSGTFPTRPFKLFCGLFIVSLGIAWWLSLPILWGFSALTLLLLGILLFRSSWFSQSLTVHEKQLHGSSVPDSLESWLKEHQPVFESLFEHNPNIVFLLDRQACIIKVNGNTEQIMGYLNAEMEKKPIRELLTRESVEHSLQAFLQAGEGKPQTFKTAIQHKDGYRVDVDVTAAPIKEGLEVTGIIVIGQDITSTKRTEERIRHMAYYDDMTGLPNRRLFVSHLNAAMVQAWEQQRSIAVFFIDIDRFKVVNECFGHDYGDMLLLQLAERFSRCIQEDDYLARTEGDEFALFFTDLSPDQSVKELAQRVFRVLEEPFSLEQYQLHITASIGIALLSEDDLDADSLTKCADIALTRAKENGKNTYQIFNSDMKSIALKRLTMENDLRRALSQNELMLQYQPQMDIQSGSIVGFEALIRWLHPERGMVSPAEFIPFAEESGLIVPIGEWVMQEACRQNKQWQNEGLIFAPVSVNISTRQFLQHDLRQKVSGVLADMDLDPAYLELEITESSTMDVDYAIMVLLELKALGVKISIDDFGTGYSSLSYLKKFPIDKLKIDQSFVRDIMTDPNDAAIVASIISMTQHMNLKVIAEGVETEEQLGYLRNNHCNEIQGYWFSRPVHPDQMKELIQRLNKETASPAMTKLIYD